MRTDLSKNHTLTFVMDSLLYRLLMYSTVKTALVQVVILQDLAPPPPPPSPSGPRAAPHAAFAQNCQHSAVSAGGHPSGAGPRRPPAGPWGAPNAGRAASPGAALCTPAHPGRAGPSLETRPLTLAQADGLPGSVAWLLPS